MKKIYLVFGVIVLGLLLVTCSPNKTKKGPRIEEPQTILARGDSLTYGQGVARDQTYPAQLEERLHEEGFDNYSVINAGISGETIEETLDRIGSVLSQNPDIIILTIGGNDMLKRKSFSTAEQNLNTIIQLIQAQDIELVLSGMRAPPLVTGNYGKLFKELYPRLASKYDLAFIPHFLKKIQGKPSLNHPDLLHPNAEGYWVIVEENILPVLIPLIGG